MYTNDLGMRMGSFLRPRTIEEALGALAASRRTVLAGGTDHYPSRIVHAPDEDILDITALPGLRAIDRRGTRLVIPALATWTDVIEAGLPPALDGLVAAARQVGRAQIQNAGTVVGNLCNASPAADGIPCLLALDAEVELASVAGTRRLAVAEFVRGPRLTARRPDELAVALHIPLPAQPVRAMFEKLGARRYLVISIAMVAVSAELDAGGSIARARVAVGACSAKAERMPALEAALAGVHPDPALVRPEHLAPLAPIDDIRASAGYRTDAVLELLRRAVARLASPNAMAA